jgi:hypothetical protein
MMASDSQGLRFGENDYSMQPVKKTAAKITAISINFGNSERYINEILTAYT